MSLGLGCLVAVATAFVCEGVFFLYLSLRGEEFSYVSRSHGSAVLESAEAPPEDGGQAFVLHPFFGYVLRSGLTVEEYLGRGGRDASDALERMRARGEAGPWHLTRANNLGFFSSQPFPSNDQGSFQIGIFGGSAAQWFALQAGDYLADLLDEVPELRGRPIKVLNFALASHKQPQSLAVLAYALAVGQRFDLVVTIDGFNEAALGSINAGEGVETSLPAVTMSKGFETILTAPTSDRAVRYLGEIAEARSSVNRAQARYRRARLAVSAVLWKLRRDRARARLESLAADPPAWDSEGVLYTSARYAPEKDPALTIADQWAASSRAMAALAKSSGAEYLHTLQPNQYFGSRRFSAEERSVAIAEASPYRQAVQEIYPQLLDRGEALQRDGVQFLDATSLFDNVQGTVYSDNCCHYNQRGNELLAEFIAARFVSEAVGRPDELGNVPSALSVDSR
jgi:hypothetical protein